MKVNCSMPTFSKLYQRCIKNWITVQPKQPYLAFLIAFITASAIFPIAWIVRDSIPFLVPLIFDSLFPVWGPVICGNIAFFLSSSKTVAFHPSLTIRLVIISIVIFGCHYLRMQSRPYPPENQDEVVLSMCIWGAQCILLLIIEPFLRWMLREST